MIEETAFLVVSEEENGLAKTLGIGHQGIDELRDVPGAEVRRPVGVFTIRFRGNDPRHLWQLPRTNVLAKDIQKPDRITVVGQNIRSRLGLLCEGRSEQSVLILMEIE